MSKNFSIDPKKLTVYYSGNTLSIIAGGMHRRFKENETGKEIMAAIYEAAYNFKNNPTNKHHEELRKYLDSSYRMEIGEQLLKDIYGNIYLKNYPDLVVDPRIAVMFKSYIEQSGKVPESMINMWKLLITNPNKQVQKDMVNYIDTYGVPVTDYGYMVLYKSVRNKEKVIEKLTYIIGQEYFTLLKQGLNPASYYLYDLPFEAQKELDLDRFHITKAEILEYRDYRTESYNDDTEETEYDYTVLQPLGNIAQLYQEYIIQGKASPDGAVVWEPYHNGDYGMHIELGKPVTMPRYECDPDINRECSYGLHVGSYEYVSSFHQNGETVLACLVNPRDIVALPKYDNSKIRVCSYLPYGIINVNEQGKWEEIEQSYWEEGFIDYEVEELTKELAELQELIENIEEDKKLALHQLSDIVRERIVTLTK